MRIYLVAMQDNGRSGKKIGCDDSIIGVEREVARTVAPLRAALEQLLSLHDPYYGESGLYNALYRSSLALQSLAIDAQGQATVKHSGALVVGGACDDPRVFAQLKETALQFSTVKGVTALVNGQELTEILSEKG